MVTQFCTQFVLRMFPESGLNTDIYEKKLKNLLFLINYVKILNHQSTDIGCFFAMVVLELFKKLVKLQNNMRKI